LYALVSLRFNGLSRGELPVNMQFGAQRTRMQEATLPGSDTTGRTRDGG